MASVFLINDDALILRLRPDDVVIAERGRIVERFNYNWIFWHAVDVECITDGDRVVNFKELVHRCWQRVHVILSGAIGRNGKIRFGVYVPRRRRIRDG